jgi:hypothetical protein
MVWTWATFINLSIAVVVKPSQISAWPRSCTYPLSFRQVLCLYHRHLSSPVSDPHQPAHQSLSTLSQISACISSTAIHPLTVLGKSLCLHHSPWACLIRSSSTSPSHVIDPSNLSGTGSANPYNGEPLRRISIFIRGLIGISWFHICPVAIAGTSMQLNSPLLMLLYPSL